MRVISVSDAEEEPDQHSIVHASAIVITHLEDSSDEERKGMALNIGSRSLRDLMKARNKAPVSK